MDFQLWRIVLTRTRARLMEVFCQCGFGIDRPESAPPDLAADLCDARVHLIRAYTLNGKSSHDRY
jgi:hypothetical protein